MMKPSDASQKRLNKLDSILNIGSHDYAKERKSIRCMEHDAIETMAIGVQWASSIDHTDSCVSSKVIDAEKEYVSSRNTAMTVAASHEVLHNEAPDVERAAAATVASILRASRRRAIASSAVSPDTTTNNSNSNSSNNNNNFANTYTNSHSFARSPYTEEPLPRANKSTECKSWRLMLLNLIGISLIAGGIGWAIWQYVNAPRYESVATGVPVGMMLCSDTDSSSSKSSSITGNATTYFTKEQVLKAEKLCQALEEWQQDCTFVILYNFTIPRQFEGDGINSTSVDDFYSGIDTWQFADPNQHSCHKAVETSQEEYMTRQNLVIHYQGGDLAGSNFLIQPTLQPHTTAAIVASIGCGLGLLILCLSLLECLC